MVSSGGSGQGPEQGAGGWEDGGRGRLEVGRERRRRARGSPLEWSAQGQDGVSSERRGREGGQSGRGRAEKTLERKKERKQSQWQAGREE